MPAATAEKRARQRANKLLRMETEATTLSDVLLPVQTAEITSESLPAPLAAPTSFTISYTPVAISYPEPVNPTAQLPTDAIRVTRDQLADILHQSYVHGSEHGWKTHYAAAKERLQAEYEQDMQAATIKFAEHEKLIHEEAYNRGFEYGSDGCEAQLASLHESLTAEHHEQHLATLADISKRCQESHEAGIQEERERWESARASQVNVTTQTDLTTTTSSISVQTDHPVAFAPTMATASVQTNLPITSLPSSATISTQTEPLLPTVTLSESLELSVPIPIPSTPVLKPFNWADDTVSLPTIPIISPKQPRDLTSLRSSSKNPFSSLQRRHRYPKLPQTASSRHHIQSYPTQPPLRHTPPFLNTSLDWHRDPRLFELGRVLRTLGWSHP